MFYNRGRKIDSPQHTADQPAVEILGFLWRIGTEKDQDRLVCLQSHGEIFVESTVYNHLDHLEITMTNIMPTCWTGLMTI